MTTSESISILGGTVLRALPPETLSGLTAGLLKLEGGVIRFAPGEGKAGQLVRHFLLPQEGLDTGGVLERVAAAYFGPGQALAALRTKDKSQSADALLTRQVLDTATSIMGLAGMSLAVSSVSFNALSLQLDQVNRRLQEVAADVKAVRDLLERRERAELKAALDTLKKAAALDKSDLHRELIVSAQQTLAVKRTQFEDLLKAADTVELAAANEAYFSIAALGTARCFAEVGSISTALHELEAATAFRREQVRRVAREMILGGNPDRLLYAEFVEQLPGPYLTEVLDFFYDESRGLAWLDELRGRIGTYYPTEDNDASGHLAPFLKVGESLSSRMARAGRALVTGSADPRVRDRDLQIHVPILRRFHATTAVLDGYVDTYRAMAQSKVTPSDLQHQLATVPDELKVDGYVIIGYEKPSPALAG